MLHLLREGVNKYVRQDKTNNKTDTRNDNKYQMKQHNFSSTFLRGVRRRPPQAKEVCTV